MTHKPVKRAPDNITLAEIEKIASDEITCLDLFERMRFPKGLRCTTCGAAEAAGHCFTRHRSRPPKHLDRYLRRDLLAAQSKRRRSPAQHLGRAVISKSPAAASLPGDARRAVNPFVREISGQY